MSCLIPDVPAKSRKQAIQVTQCSYNLLDLLTSELSYETSFFFLRHPGSGTSSLTSIRDRGPALTISVWIPASAFAQSYGVTSPASLFKLPSSLRSSDVTRCRDKSAFAQSFQLHKEKFHFREGAFTFCIGFYVRCCHRVREWSSVGKRPYPECGLPRSG